VFATVELLVNTADKNGGVVGEYGGHGGVVGEYGGYDGW